jgi:FtsH-binding integral membrane protein
VTTTDTKDWDWDEKDMQPAVFGNQNAERQKDLDDIELGREAQPAHQDLSILQAADKDLPAEIRLGFIKKVYGLVIYMLVITFGITTPFVFATDSTFAFFQANPWLSTLCMLCFLGLYAMNFALLFSMMCNCGDFMAKYLNMFKTYPQNVIFLTFVSATFGVLVGNICAQYTQSSVLWVFFASAVMVTGLTVYAVKTAADFTSMGGYVMAGLIGLMLTGFLSMFLPGLSGIYAGMGAMLFGFIIVYDTQLIFGNATPLDGSVDAPQRQFEYTLDMHAFAAYQLYLDYVNFFLYMLRLFGERR